MLIGVKTRSSPSEVGRGAEVAMADNQLLYRVPYTCHVQRTNNMYPHRCCAYYRRHSPLTRPSLGHGPAGLSHRSLSARQPWSPPEQQQEEQRRQTLPKWLTRPPRPQASLSRSLPIPGTSCVGRHTSRVTSLPYPNPLGTRPSYPHGYQPSHSRDELTRPLTPTKESVIHNAFQC